VTFLPTYSIRCSLNFRPFGALSYHQMERKIPVIVVLKHWFESSALLLLHIKMYRSISREKKSFNVRL